MSEKSGIYKKKPIQILKEIYNERGIPGFYKGYLACVTRDIPGVGSTRKGKPKSKKIKLEEQEAIQGYALKTRKKQKTSNFLFCSSSFFLFPFQSRKNQVFSFFSFPFWSLFFLSISV